MQVRVTLLKDSIEINKYKELAFVLISSIISFSGENPELDSGLK